MPKPLEKPHEPKREKYENEEDYLQDVEEYKKDKANYDFWIQFEIRSLLIVDDEKSVILTEDFKALEKRLSGIITKDPALIRMITEHIDPHGMTASFCFPEELKGVHPNDVKKVAPHLRNKGKTVGFAADYGGTEFTISRNLGIPKEEARKMLDNYWAGFAVQAEYNQQALKEARRSGYVQTLFGHKRHLEGLNSENWGIRGYNERLCANAPVQGSAADVITLSQIAVDKDAVLRAIGYTLRLQVYDELMGSVPEKYVRIAAERVKQHMEATLDGKDAIIPLEADLDWGKTYADSK